MSYRDYSLCKQQGDAEPSFNSWHILDGWSITIEISSANLQSHENSYEELTRYMCNDPT